MTEATMPRPWRVFLWACLFAGLIVLAALLLTRR